MVQTWDEVKLVANEWDWRMYFAWEVDGEVKVDFSQYSTAGENFWFSASGHTPQELANNVMEYARDFSPDEHVRSVMDMRGAPGLLSRRDSGPKRTLSLMSQSIWTPCLDSRETS